MALGRYIFGCLLFIMQVDMHKVNLSVIRPWIVKKVVELVGFEDEVVVEYAMGLLEDDSQPVRPKEHVSSQLSCVHIHARPPTHERCKSI